jgi:hypothetical protein
MVDPEQLAQVIAAVTVPAWFAGIAALCFPSIRSAVADRIRQRTLRHAEATDVVAQLAVLRGEVYALRVELAQTTQALRSGNEAKDGALAARELL